MLTNSQNALNDHSRRYWVGIDPSIYPSLLYFSSNYGQTTQCSYIFLGEKPELTRDATRKYLQQCMVQQQVLFTLLKLSSGSLDFATQSSAFCVWNFSTLDRNIVIVPKVHYCVTLHYHKRFFFGGVLYSLERFPEMLAAGSATIGYFLVWPLEQMAVSMYFESQIPVSAYLLSMA